MEELEYPLDAMFLLRKKKALLRQLTAESEGFPVVKVAILGGSTTDELSKILELFLLNKGLKPSFYQSDYNCYWQDVMFENPALLDFAPDVIYVHTTNRNLLHLPSVGMYEKEVEDLFQQSCEHFQRFWDKAETLFHCPLIQNNFEPFSYRLLGHQDGVLPYGHSRFLDRMNQFMVDYAQEHSHFYLHDLNYTASSFGVERWHDSSAWFSAKYALAMEAIPHLAFSVANIMVSLHGKNKKAVVVDLDNTLWGGVVGEDGVENLKLGLETGTGEAFLAFQGYLKSLQEIGVILAIASKNEEENAISGLKHPDSLLSPEDFMSIKANWNPKDENIRLIAQELNLGADSFVFVDDNPAERELVRQNVMGIGVPPMEDYATYREVLHRSGYFEVTNLTQEDRARHEMYQQNKDRTAFCYSTGNYEEYLKSLDMVAEIAPFQPVFLERISQLCGKTNQFNVTTKRYTLEEIQSISTDEQYLHFYGKLWDRFGENGLVSVVIGRREGDRLSLDLWLMSCRVLKRNFEHAMLDQVVEACRQQGISTLIGTYLPTIKNKMVASFYEDMGFSLEEYLEAGGSTWKLLLCDYKRKNNVIKIEE